MRLGIDFDGTLDRLDVQQAVRQAIEDGHDIWVVTGRSGRTWNGLDNDEFHEVCDYVGIKPYQRIFCGYQHWEVGKKANFYLDMFKNNLIFDLHLDNHPDELNNIRKLDIGIKLINVEDLKWKEKWNIAIG